VARLGKNCYISSFWGREREIATLRDWDRKSAKLVTLYGRRRVGKTRLVEESFKGSAVLAIEGVEGEGQAAQQRLFLARMAEFFGRSELKLIRPQSWIDVLSLLSDCLKRRPCVVLLDEFQWLASGRSQLVSHFKYAWDNFFTKKNRALFILCGSVSSFMVNRVLKSKALYGRVDLELHLQPLVLGELSCLVQAGSDRGELARRRSMAELVELYMVVGGVPQYLKMIDPSRSVYLNVEKLLFTPNGYLVNEFERLFASHFGTNRRYRDILIALARRGWADRDRVQKDCQLGSGGRISEYLDNLELAGFIESYRPIDRPRAVRNLRYRLADQYLLFYFRFVHDRRDQINRLRGQVPRSQLLPDRSYRSWRGLAFERVCYVHRQEIASRLGFGAVSYEAGSWFGKGASDRTTQIDLLFSRADGVITLCEVKFTDEKVGLDVIREVERKIEILPNPKHRSIERVLISASEPTRQLRDTGYFDTILGLDVFF
jgi:AAA+ ATPase superfamily predicted ATPase